MADYYIGLSEGEFDDLLEGTQYVEDRSLPKGHKVIFTDGTRYHDGVCVKQSSTDCLLQFVD